LLTTSLRRIGDGTRAGAFIRLFLVQKMIPIFIRTLRPPPDILEEYRAEFGSLGTALYNNVLKARASPGSQTIQGTPAMTSVSSTVVTSGVLATTPRSITALQTGMSFQSATFYFKSVTVTKGNKRVRNIVHCPLEAV